MNIIEEWLLDREKARRAPVIVQGITGRYGSLHTRLILDYETKIEAGVVPGRGGMEVHGVPVYNTMKEAVQRTGAVTSIIFVPAPFFLGAVVEALESGIKLVVGITEHVPIRDTLRALRVAQRHGASIIGPNSPGLILPKAIKLGIMPPEPFTEGGIALFSRSGTLTYEVANFLSKDGLGQSIALGVGGDPINCTTLMDGLSWVQEKDGIEGLVIVGEIGGDEEEKLARYMKSIGFKKPTVAYIAGRHAPKEKRMGHAGAIIYGSFGTAEAKVRAFEEAGVPVAEKPAEIPGLMRRLMRG